MTDVVTTPVTSGYNINRINNNFDALRDSINEDVIHSIGGNNTMNQDLDMNGNSLLNIDTDFANGDSLLTVQAAKEHFYQIGLVPTAVSSGDAINYGQTSQLIEAAVIGTDPANVVLYDQLASVEVDKGASLIGIEDAGGLYAGINVEDALAEVMAKASISASFTQTGTAAITTTFQQKNQRYLDILDFVPEADVSDIMTGNIDAAPALNAAIAEAIRRGAGSVYLPSGSYLLNSKITVSLTGLHGLAIEGDGMGLTNLICADPSGDGIQIDCAAGDWWMAVSPSNPLRIANLSICSTQLNLGVGLKINGGSLEGRPRAACVLDHIEIRATNSINNQAFLTALHLNDCGDMHAVGCRFINGGITNVTPTGVRITSTDATTDPTVFNFDHCEWYYGAVGLTSGNNPEGIYLTQCTMVGITKGVVWSAGAESGLHVLGGHYNCSVGSFDLDGIFDFTIIGTVMFLTGGASSDAHVKIQNGNSFTVSGNSFFNGTNGVSVGGTPAGTRGGIISGNQFGSTGTGISISTLTNNLTVGINGFTNVTNRVVGNGSGGYTHKRMYTQTFVSTLVGGSASETVTASIPAGVFGSRPTVVLAGTESSSVDYIVSPVSTTATATSISFRVVRRDGVTISAGAVRFHFMASE